MAVPSLGELWRLARLLEGVASLEQRNRESFADVALRLDAIEARAAAATAASVTASAHVAAPARAVGALQERVRQMGVPALPAPARKKPKM